MAATGTILVLTTGTITFTNEWLQKHELNWRIPIATFIAAAATDVIDKASHRSATVLGVLALIAGLTAPLAGKSPIQEFNSIIGKAPNKQAIQKKVG